MKKLVSNKIDVGSEKHVVLVDVCGRKEIPNIEYNWKSKLGVMSIFVAYPLKYSAYWNGLSKNIAMSSS